VDEQEPRPMRPQQVALSERSDRRRMGTCRAADPAGKTGGGKRTVIMREVVTVPRSVTNLNSTNLIYLGCNRHE
jgi:hypothetical protein